MREIIFRCAVMVQNFLLIFYLCKVGRKLHKENSFEKEKRKSMSHNGIEIRLGPIHFCLQGGHTDLRKKLLLFMLCSLILSFVQDKVGPFIGVIYVLEKRDYFAKKVSSIFLRGGGSLASQEAKQFLRIINFQNLLTYLGLDVSSPRYELSSDPYFSQILLNNCSNRGHMIAYILGQRPRN